MTDVTTSSHEGNVTGVTTSSYTGQHMFLFLTSVPMDGHTFKHLPIYFVILKNTVREYKFTPAVQPANLL